MLEKLNEAVEISIHILGGGPAGSTCAYYLAKNGFDVKLYESKPKWRKPCGGGLSWRVLTEFDDILNQIKIPTREVNEVVIDVEGKKSAVNFQKPCGLVTDRLVFDNELRRLAKNEGCEIIYKKTEIEEISGETIVDARGFYPNNRNVPLLTSICKLKNADFTFAYYKKFNKVGYFWIFPMSNRLADVGVGELDPKCARNLDAKFEWFINKIGAKVVEKKGWCESIEINKKIVERSDGKTIIKIGERAGLVNPLTGEGIYHAMKSGKVLAESIQQKNLIDYIRFVKKTERKFRIYKNIRNLYLLPIPKRKVVIFGLKLVRHFSVGL